MNHTPTWTELALLLTAIGASYRWWTERRDKRSALQTANDTLQATIERLKESEAEAEKTVRTLQETIAAKNVELAAKDRIIDRRERRIDHLETLAFGRSGIEVQR